MDVTVDDNIHQQHADALLTQLVRDTVEVLEQYGLFSREQNKDLANDLLYRICAVLDGSSFPGTLGGDEIAPFVGFYMNHRTDNPLIPENGAAMHYKVGQFLDEYFASNGRPA